MVEIIAKGFMAEEIYLFVLDIQNSLLVSTSLFLVIIWKLRIISSWEFCHLQHMAGK
jgi:hypothetical protein